jgi:hypothetical protein
MRPEINDYKILYQASKYYVLNPYDLYAMPCLKISGKGWETRKDAEIAIEDHYERDLKTYERLKDLGRSFPDND